MNKALIFPKGFLWGSSTSAYQVEGGNFNCDWWQFEQKGKIKDGSSSRLACNHYHLFEKDLILAQKLGHNGHRFSLEWSRIQPMPGTWDPKEVNHYQKVLGSLKRLHFTTFLTLQHFTLPLWFAKMGGWENPQSPKIFANYVKFCAENFGKMVDFWLTINEPQVVIANGYVQGNFPPEKRNPLLAIKAANNLMGAHRQAYREIHSVSKGAMVSFTTLQNLLSPSRAWFIPEIMATKFFSYIQNDWFLNQAGNCLDFIGLDFYHTSKVRCNLFPEFVQEGREVSDLGWVICPKAIYEILKNLSQRNLPLYITENGIADADDDQRPSFILRYLTWVWKALQEGIDVRSYLHWTLMDNFEWCEGISAKFGLCQTNYESLERVPRKSAKMFKEIIEANGITESIVKKYEPNLRKEIFR